MRGIAGVAGSVSGGVGVPSRDETRGGRAVSAIAAIGRARLRQATAEGEAAAQLTNSTLAAKK
jgi:hypothetical protein